MKLKQPKIAVRGYLLFIFLSSIKVITFSQNIEEIFNNSTTICQKGVYEFNEMGSESIVFKWADNSCIPENKGIPNQILLNWTIDRPGILTFLLKSKIINQDIDFELYRIKDNQLHLVRCMATGPQVGESAAYNAHCLGVTGLLAENGKVLENKKLNLIANGSL